jgi:hypothetical protein
MKDGLNPHPASNNLRSSSFPEEAHTSVIFRAFYRRFATMKFPDS